MYLRTTQYVAFAFAMEAPSFCLLLGADHCAQVAGMTPP